MWHIILCVGGWALTESSTLYYQPLHLTSFINIVLLFLFYLYSEVNKYYLTWHDYSPQQNRTMSQVNYSDTMITSQLLWGVHQDNDDETNEKEDKNHRVDDWQPVNLKHNINLYSLSLWPASQCSTCTVEWADRLDKQPPLVYSEWVMKQIFTHQWVLLTNGKITAWNLLILHNYCKQYHVVWNSEMYK